MDKNHKLQVRNYYVMKHLTERVDLYAYCDLIADPRNLAEVRELVDLKDQIAVMGPAILMDRQKGEVVRYTDNVENLSQLPTVIIARPVNDQESVQINNFKNCREFLIEGKIL